MTDVPAELVLDEPVTSRASKRKHNTTQGAPRKRVTRACEPCRRLKERCTGIFPCTRCVRYKRPCQFDLPPRTPRPGTSSPGPKAKAHDNPDAERVKKLEQIVQLLTGTSELNKQDAAELDVLLQQQEAIREPQQPIDPALVDGLDAGSDDEEYGLDETPDGGRYLGELSHNEFSTRLQNKVKTELNSSSTPESMASVASIQPMGSRMASQVQSKSSVVSEAIALLPPSEVAYFLVHVFFDFAQTNYSYVDEALVRDKLRQLYSSSPETLGINDAPWVSIILLLFAIGTQFAHLVDKNVSEREQPPPSSDSGSSNTRSADDQIALDFYQCACKLMPDVLAAASVESVQAFLLFGTYALPIDVAGLACSYFGVAIRLATLNGMHRNHHGDLEPEQMELRRRIWWTAYTLERRICILHGRPISVSRSEVECSLPSDGLGQRVFTTTANTTNVLAMIKLSDFLETARDRIFDFRRAPKQQRGAQLQSIKQLKDDIDRYWKSLPRDTVCRDLDPAKPLFRFNIHLTLMYHLIHIFIGRSFILGKSCRGRSNGMSLSSATTRESLVNHCIESSITVINLCNTLSERGGIARASYTEFSSCSAALLAVLARRISEPGAPASASLQTTCDMGLRLLKKMSVGIYANSEKLTVEALETAIRALQANTVQEAPRTDTSLSQDSVRQAYTRFRDWATMRNAEVIGGAGGGLQLGLHPDEPPAAAPKGMTTEEDVILEEQGVCARESFDIFDLGDFGSVPGLDEWFKFGLN